MNAKRTRVMLACLVLAGLASSQSVGEPAPTKPARIVATYDAGLAGISLGEFKVAATLADGAYEMDAQGRFSLLAGLLYKATGKTTSTGTLTAASPRPALYTLSFEDNKKSQRLRMRFSNGAVSDVTIVPEKRRGRDVPVTPAQLKGVLDPLTAAFLSVRSEAQAGDLSVCKKTVPVYDGRQRFDIVLSPKRSETLDAKGLPKSAAVCRVRYQPISGYRPDHPGVQYMTENEKVEVWLVPIPGSELHIPYQIVVPTAWGSGTVDLKGLKADLGATQRAAAP